MQRAETFFTRTSVLGRLIVLAAVGGVLAAAMIMPIVAATGVLVRNEADKFTTLSLTAASLPQRSEILDRNGHLLAYVYGVDVPYSTSPSNAAVLQYYGWDRQPVTYSQINVNMVNAIVAIEDYRYWVHGAIDLRGTIRAALNDIQHKPVQGGSTIAQQYVKNVLLLSAEEAGDTGAEKAAYAETLSRKLNELRLAVGVEHEFTKQQILAGYLNDAYFGNNAYGIEAAAETYFGTTVDKLTVTQAATLAGIVENPSKYNPITDPTTAVTRRNTVLARMAQTNTGLTAAQAAAAEATPLGLHISTPESGCTAASVGTAGFFCEYVEEAFLHDPAYGKTAVDRAKLLSTGGLQIYTTLDPKDQQAANSAVNFVEPGHSNYYNPGHNADTEALIQPGTGQIRALAENAAYGTGKGQTEIDYAVNTAYGGSSQGVQTGSSSKLFTLITALKQGTPFGFQLSVPGTETINGYTNCQGGPAGQYQGINGAYNVTNAEGPQSASTQSLYTGTTQSVNVFYAQLEKRVGLCNVVHTAADLGMTRVDGTSLLSSDKTPEGTLTSADNIPSFTLGSVGVAPLSMAAAYATVAARGTYCAPVAIDKIVTDTGSKLSVPSAGCHRVLSTDVADAVNYILQGVLVSPGTAATVGGLNGREAAGKTGTSNVANGFGTPYAAFAGYTPSLVAYVSVFNPISPTVHDTMGGSASCYRLEFGGLACPGEMFGTNAPASTWHMTFDYANLGAVTYFVPVPADSPFNSKGNGQVVQQPKKKGKGGKGGGNGGGGNGGGNGFPIF
ncbi:MAG TPA: transglycosylase domain-containing protein [Streptosporangiaceae bacterium]|nr:transglycosylase domain-containing protein [Streptosporangiaceae bacterium]